MKFLYWLTLSIAIISVNFDCAYGQVEIKRGKAVMSPDMGQAIKDFKACIRSKEPLIFSKDHKICGVTAESRSELLDLLQCPEQKGYSGFSILNVNILEKRYISYLFRCGGLPAIEIEFKRSSDKVIVSGIGELEN